jgi:predicted SAM-dependent methyltransferase
MMRGASHQWDFSMDTQRSAPGPRNDREAKLFQAIDTSGFGLELGPSFRPAAPRARGFNIEIADHVCTDDLRRKYEDVPGALENIEEVDYVLTEGLYAGIRKPERFDFIIASHVIEHVPDLIQFLRDCERLLKPDGVLSLAVPDKRYCFDAARSTSTLGNVLRAHEQKRVKPDPYDVLDQYLNGVTKNRLFGWHKGYEFEHEALYTTEEAMYWYGKALAGEYIDIHCWQFTPSTFGLLISELSQLGHLDLRIAASHDTTDHEFFVSLKKGNQSSFDRDALLRAAIFQTVDE